MANTWPSITSMAPRSTSCAATGAWLAALVAAVACGSSRAVACPFCTALEPTLSQQRAQAQVVLLAENETAGSEATTELRIHRVIVGGPRAAAGQLVRVPVDRAGKPGSLLLAFGDGKATDALADLRWRVLPVTETSYAYFARLPASATPTAERLRYFARYLENSDPLIAQDAYLEFGHARFDEVASVIDALSAEQLRRWIGADAVPQSRKGFYGLALGLATDPATRAANAAFLKQQILTPDDDFRAGFDGLLGGYLLLTGVDGLRLLDERILANPKAADGDVRHALVALRFYHEYGHEIPADRLRQSLRQVLMRPEFAAAAITDLARWKDWNALPTIVPLYGKAAYATPTTRQAIVGYLLACGQPAAERALAELRRQDPQGVDAAEQVLTRLGGVVPEGR